MDNELENLKRILKLKGQEALETPSKEKNNSDREGQVSAFVCTTLAIIGFLTGCNNYINHASRPGYILDKLSFMDFLYPFIFPILGALIGWIVVKILFSAFR